MRKRLTAFLIDISQMDAMHSPPLMLAMWSADHKFATGVARELPHHQR